MTRRATPNRTPANPWLAWLVLCGLLSGITFGQVLGGHRSAPWWAWAVTPPTVLLITVLLRRRRGSRLFAAGVMLSLGWAFGLLLHLCLTLTLHFIFQATTG